MQWLHVLICCAALSDGSQILEQHEDNVYLIDFTADGRTMATASGDNTAAIWDLSSGKPKFILPHDGPVYAAIFSPDRTLLATGSGDGQVAIFNTRDGTQVRSAKQHKDAVYCLDFSPDGKQLATVGGNGGGGDTTCRLWDVATLVVRAEFTGHSFPVYGVAFAPDGKTLATSSRDKTVRLWRLPDGQLSRVGGTHERRPSLCVLAGR